MRGNITISHLVFLVSSNCWAHWEGQGRSGRNQPHYFHHPQLKPFTKSVEYLKHIWKLWLFVSVWDLCSGRMSWNWKKPEERAAWITQEFGELMFWNTKRAYSCSLTVTEWQGGADSITNSDSSTDLVLSAPVQAPETAKEVQVFRNAKSCSSLVELFHSLCLSFNPAWFVP